MELLNLKIAYPKQFCQATQPIFQPNLYVVPKSKGLGIIGMAEIVVALHLSGEIVGADDKPIPLIQLANTFECMFNLSFGSIYDKQDAIFNRKPYNITKALDFLRATILREDKKRNQR